MKIIALNIFFILWIFLLGCTSKNSTSTVSKENQVDENIDSLIKTHSGDRLFSDFWFGMNQNQFNKVIQSLKKNGIVTDSCYRLVYSGNNYCAKLFPTFVNDSLFYLKLKFDEQRIFETVSKGMHAFVYSSCSSVKPVLQLYLEKYKSYNLLSRPNNITEYIIHDEGKQINIHFKKLLESINVNDEDAVRWYFIINHPETKPHEYGSLEHEAEMKELKKEVEYARKHPLYVKRECYTEFYILYQNYSHYLKEAKSLKLKIELENQNRALKKTRQQRGIDSLQKKTMENI